jgi:hypothetical protein
MKTVETHTTGFIKTLESVEAGLMKQIQYLTQVSTGTRQEMFHMEYYKQEKFINSFINHVLIIFKTVEFLLSGC